MDFTYWMTQLKPKDYQINEQSRTNLELLKSHFGNVNNIQVTKYYINSHKFLLEWFKHGFEKIQ